jgi:transcriptional regulator with XRE-family HTH domain
MGTPREQLAELLKQLRNDAGYPSHAALARAINVSRSVITRAESAAYPAPQDETLIAWAAATKADLPRIMDLAERARNGTPDWFASYTHAEAQANTLLDWEPIIATPLLHTAAYARELLLKVQRDTSPEKIEPLVEAKLARRAIFERPDPPYLIAIMDESVLHRLIGSPQIMTEQLEFVVEMAARPCISVQVVPAGNGANAGLAGPLIIASGRDGIPDVLHTDAVPEGWTTEKPERVRRARIAFDQLRADALSQKQSREVSMEAIEKWKAQSI